MLMETTVKPSFGQRPWNKHGGTKSTLTEMSDRLFFKLWFERESIFTCLVNCFEKVLMEQSLKLWIQVQNKYLRLQQKVVLIINNLMGKLFPQNNTQFEIYFDTNNYSVPWLAVKYSFLYVTSKVTAKFDHVIYFSVAINWFTCSTWLQQSCLFKRNRTMPSRGNGAITETKH